LPLLFQLTPLELSFLSPDLPDDVVLRRLYILWTVKESYTKALGQPFGFDFSRIECNIPEETINVDGQPLRGWEFRLFKANLGIVRKEQLVEEVYQCTCAIYRGGEKTRFVWTREEKKETDKWLRFVRVDDLIEYAKTNLANKSIPKTPST